MVNAPRGDQHEAADAGLADRTAVEMSLIDAAIHDLRNPAHVTEAELRRLELTLASASLRENVETLARARAGLKELLIVCFDLADLARNGIAGGIPSSQPIELASVFAALRTRFEQRATYQRIRLRVLVPRISLITERFALARVLAELVENAMKHSAATTVTVRARGAGRFVIICVADDGQGIEPDRLCPSSGVAAHAPEFAPDPHDNEHRYGLIACRIMVEEALHGSLRCRSMPGRGTRFSICLPVAPASDT